MTNQRLLEKPAQNAGAFGYGQMFGWAGGGKSLKNVYFCVSKSPGHEKSEGYGRSDRDTRTIHRYTVEVTVIRGRDIDIRKSHRNMAKKTEKTNAARLLDKAGVKYNLIPYEFDENDLAAQHVADSLGQDIARVFKTLVLHGDKTGYIVAVVPGNMEVNLKALAKVSGNKKVEMIAMKDLLQVTGYIRGGCSPVGMKKRFPTYFHATATDFETIYVSAGVRGLQIEIAPKALIAFTGSIVADVATKA